MKTTGCLRGRVPLIGLLLLVLLLRRGSSRRGLCWCHDAASYARGRASRGSPLRWVLQSAGQRQDALQLGLILLRVHACPLLRLLPGSLRRGPRLEFASDGLQVVWHLRVGLKEEQLEVSRLVLELDLRPLLQDIGDGAAVSEQRQDLAPVRPLNHVKPSHEGLLLVLAPRPPRRVGALSPGVR